MMFFYIKLSICMVGFKNCLVVQGKLDFFKYYLVAVTSMNNLLLMRRNFSCLSPIYHLICRYKNDCTRHFLFTMDICLLIIF